MCEVPNVLSWLPDWQMCGASKRVSERYLGPIITKSLIVLRYKINCLIDSSASRPEDVSPTHWKELQAIRATEEAQEKSAQMRSISKGKGSVTVQMKAIEREAVSRLVSSRKCLLEYTMCTSFLSVTFTVIEYVKEGVLCLKRCQRGRYVSSLTSPMTSYVIWDVEDDVLCL